MENEVLSPEEELDEMAEETEEDDLEVDEETE